MPAQLSWCMSVPRERAGCVGCDSPAPRQMAQTGLSFNRAFNGFGGRGDGRGEGRAEAAERRKGSKPIQQGSVYLATFHHQTVLKAIPPSR